LPLGFKLRERAHHGAGVNPPSRSSPVTTDLCFITAARRCFLRRDDFPLRALQYPLEEQLSAGRDDARSVPVGARSVIIWLSRHYGILIKESLLQGFAKPQISSKNRSDHNMLNLELILWIIGLRNGARPAEFTALGFAHSDLPVGCLLSRPGFLSRFLTRWPSCYG